MDICYQGLCGLNADCITLGNRPKCVCPAGTTGNPTKSCSALQTETRVTLKPLVEIKPFDPALPIEPTFIPASSPLPPTYTEPTPYPPVPDLPRPPAQPIIPAVYIACENNDQCSTDNSCINGLCYDVCSIDICGENADCSVNTHRPVCTCPPGTTGDPQERCVALLTDRPLVFEPIGDYPTTKKTEKIVPSQEPAKTTPQPMHGPPTQPPLEPALVLPQVPPIPPLIPVGCENNDNCKYDMSCVNKLCMDICYEGLCGSNADCRTLANRPMCICPAGTTGNPTIKCTALATEIPPPMHPPLQDEPKDYPDTPLSPALGPATTTPSPTYVTTLRPSEPPVTVPPAPPISPTIIIACKNNDDCDTENSCVNFMCLNACQLGVCGEDATCIHKSHRPVCICPPGTTGNPQIRCTSILTSIPPVKTPVSDEAPPLPGKPIVPIAGPTSSRPPPIGIPPTSKPQDPIVLEPPLVPTPPPIAVGCESSDDCPFDNSCINKLCMDICHPGFCGENADCSTKRNRPTCLCPPGTTGNPTVKCMAMEIDRLVPLQPPLADAIPPLPDESIVAGHPPSTTFAPPSFITAVIPPEPQEPRPLPPPVLPSFTIACENNDDCTLDFSCINSLCYDVCSLGVCGVDANCVVDMHRPVCTCPPGMTGHPLHSCSALMTEIPIVHSPVAGPETTVPDEHIVAGKGPASSTFGPIGFDPTPYPIDPPITPMPIPPTPSPIAVGCKKSSECSSETSCVNRLCMDICYQGICGDDADCVTMSHRPVCVCPPGTTGNPTIKCSAMMTVTPELYPPISDVSVRPPSASIIPTFDAPPTVPPPLSVTTLPPAQPPAIIPAPPPLVPSVIIACENNDDCDTDNACINRLCYETCSLNICGENSECLTGNHRPVCVCPPGTRGDPQIKCVAMTTERPPTPQAPITEYIPMHEETLVAAHGPSSTTPSPQGISPTPFPADPPVKTPVIPPTPPSVSVGCESNDACPYDSTCVNRLCMDICHQGLCGVNAECQTRKNRPVCTCPPGTTGNPTKKCDALATERPTTMSPLGQPVSFPPEGPIISGKVPSPTTPPPVADVPPQFPEEPKEDIPLTAPIVPPIIIACENNDDCSMDNSCLNNICYDVCALGICGLDADCVTAEHRPVCTCPPGTTGHPIHQCAAVLTEAHTLPPPMVSDHPAISDETIIPTFEGIPPLKPPLGIPPTPKPVEPIPSTPPVVPTPLPNPTGCEGNSECTFGTTCFNRLCMDICFQGLCGINADCVTGKNRPACVCPPGTTGNPTIKCTAMLIDIVETYPPVPEPSDPAIDEPIEASSITSPHPPPISDGPTNRPPEISYDPPAPPPIPPSLSIACANNDDCDIQSSCINLLCYPACALGICGKDASCTTMNHRPICTCPPGTKGDPQQRCIAIATDHFTMHPPIVATSTLPPDSPLRPVIGEKSTVQPPIFITTIGPIHPEYSPPDLVPTPSPFAISCQTNDECPFDNTCVNQLCLEICHPGLCGENADCQTVNHRPSCDCPPGTSGNPTVACLAVVTDKVTTLGPVHGLHPTYPDLSVVPGSEISSLPPPVTEKQPVHDEPRPPLPPSPVLLPVIHIACENRDECPVDYSCINHLCYDSCGLGICGVDADCKISGHRPVCTCPPGTDGDPTRQCIAKLTDVHTTKSPMAGDSTSLPEEPIVSGHDASSPAPPVVIIPTTQKEPLYDVPPPPPTPPSVVVGCESSDSCPFDNSCVNRLCLDICHPGICGDNADCRTIAHRPLCTCPPGTTGNPTLKCSALSTIEQEPLSPPLAVTSKITVETIVSGFESETPIPPATEKPAVRPTEPAIPLRPVIPPLASVTIACSNSDDCDLKNSCINMFCYDVCSLGICGEDADCKPLKHRPVCLCPPGTTGNPQIRCTAISTAVHDTRPPIVFIPAPEPKEPIYPVSAPSSTFLPPLTSQTPLPFFPTSPTFIEPITDAPLPVGCTIETECKFDEKCVSALCAKTCSVTPCSEGSECRAVADHSAVCTLTRPIGVIPECIVDTDCLDHQACVDTGCRDACLANNPCAPNAVCKGENHRPQCYCPPGYVGNPHVSCKLPELPTTPRPHDPVKPRPECLVDEDCDLSLACDDGTCRDPCTYKISCGFNAECLVTVHSPSCVCQTGFTGNPYVHCYPPTPAPIRPAPVVEPQCRINEDCPLDRACFDGYCKNPCTEANRCAANALCDVQIHRAICSCPPGLTGDPYIQCLKTAVPPIEPECRVNDDCSNELACIELRCQNPCALYDNCASNAECFVNQHRPVCSCPDGYQGNPNVFCFIAGCRDNSDCLAQEACINEDCRDPCTLQTCGVNALCRADKRKAVCYCPEKYSGDPYVLCSRPECQSDPECPSWLACIKQECNDPCNCGPGALCRVINHRPQCSCPLDHTGDPHVQCSPLPLEGRPAADCETDGDCPSKTACFQGVCKDPCVEIKPCGRNTVCGVVDTLPYRTMTCVCLEDHIGNAYEECRLKPRDPAGCTSDDECGVSEVCRNRQCLDLCSVLKPCAPEAICEVIDKKPKCTCPPGYIGNANVNCYLIPAAEPQCTIDQDCSTDRACIDAACSDPCIVEDPCGKNALCRTQQHRPVCYCPASWAGNPKEECFKPDCTKDSECVSERACINQHCVDPCTYNGPACGIDAKCRPIMHRAQCYCPVGMQGDPLTACITVGCRSNDDCPDDRACDRLNRVCIPVCTTTTCAVGAECRARNHAATCFCPPGYSGNPFRHCSQPPLVDYPSTLPPIEPECRRDSDCPSQHACINALCVNPCAQESPCVDQQQCRVVDDEPLRTMVCECPPNQILMEGGACVRPGAVVPECQVDRDCDSDELCDAGTCRKVCRVQSCGTNAVCTPEAHTRYCTCAPGFIGDPYVACRRSPPVLDKPVPECSSNDDCPDTQSCINELCVNPCVHDPCARNAFCIVRDHVPQCTCPPGYTGDPKIACSLLEIPISVGCRADSDCPSNRACVNTQCVVPCNCGENAECTIVDHRPLCVCREGFQGDPITGCYKVGCTANEQCPLDKMCYNGVCVNPCYVKDPCAINAECYPEVHQAKCRCPVGMVGDPFVRCDVAGCKENSDCPTDKACHNRMCIDPCPHTDDCAPNAECYVYQHVAGCRCPSSHPFGDPRLMCEDRPIMSDVKPQCVVDGDCPSQFACINQYCRNPCFELKPCDKSALCKVVDSLPVRTMVCECPEGYLIQLNGTCKLIDLMPPPECRSSSDCGELEACVNKQCKDPCECGPNADCDIVDHRAICTCQVNFLGTPDVGCFPIGCKVDPECADDHACYEGVCANPCLVNNPCASNAECYATGHRAYCRCPIGLKGDGYNECLIIGCRSNSDCPPNHGCVNEQCADPCLNNPCVPTAECVSLDHTAKCRCPAGTAGDPNIECLPIQHPLCSVDSECPLQLACINEECKNPCHHFEPCHDTANCRVIDTEPMRTMSCMCDDSEVTKEDGVCELVPVIRPVCEADQQCPPKEACINGFCKDPCQCGANANCEIIEHHPVCTCKEGYEGDPEVGCYDIGCFSNDDCPGTHACKNAKCVPVCGPNNEPCGRESECQGVNHEAMCICPPGSRGNPNTQCIAIGCVSDDACPNERSCINQKCISPCVYDPCLDPAECKVEGHEAVCPCPPGFNRTVDNGCEKLIVGCRVDAECPSQLACVNGKCIDLCALDPCGRFAECRVVDTLPIRLVACECLPGYQGDAAEACYPVAVCPIEKGFIMDDEGKCYCPHERGFYVDDNGNCALCRTDLGFILTDDGLCICDPSKGYIVTPAGVCDCPIPMIKDEAGVCVLGTPPPLPPGCVRNEDCSTDRMCERGACVPPCGFDPCAKYALCIDANHTAICVCIAGYSGDPYKENGCKPTFARTDFPRPDMVVNCLADGVQVDINVGDPGFNGVMYVKGYSKNEECRKLIKPDVDVGTIDFKVKFNTCGLIHEDGLARFILVLQKHPKLVTYKAQAYHIKCTYNTGEKTIAIGFNVSMLTTAGTIANTGPPPTCLMKITDQYGGDITRAEIGDLLRLRVIVEPSHIYGGFARSCVALTSGDGEDIDYQVTDERGCASDPAVFEEWQLDQDKALVANFNAFKFPSSNSIRFQCNVRVCFGKCQPVNCDGYDAFGKRRRRQAAEEDAEIFFEDESTYDSQLREINVYSQSILTIESRTGRLTAPQEVQTGPDEVCVSKWGFIIALVITALLALVAVAVAVSCWLMAYRSKPKHSGPLPHPAGFPNPLFTTPQPLAEPSPDYLS
ncbi:uncharacterized protein LOC108675679 isoform X3 [Hyalella azteca]|uniref:Uncharacterized protein LOC108675679 isoform X3 n=1 Tax=Hyalella azteca TaxID=294128 RepID=A0A979FSA4_HYAAZ|nr:uncharacterized protein LOC108675679 isoform X3 [Hyalella azteca]